MSRLTKLIRKLRASHPRPGEKLVFLHLPKTGGTTLHTQIACQFSSERIFPGRFPGLKTSLAEHGSDYDFFSGHFNATEINLIPGPLYLVTVLRDPRERLVSLYYFFRRQRADRIAPAMRGTIECVRLAQTHDLLGFLRHGDVAIVTDNTMARTLSGDASAAPRTVVEGGQTVRLTGADVVSRAVANLERFNIIGFTENLDDAYRAVANDWGFPPVTSLPHINTRTEDRSYLLKPAREQPITRAIKDELDRLTVLDREVIAHAWAIQDRPMGVHRRAA